MAKRMSRSPEERVEDQRRRSREYMKQRRNNDPAWAAERRLCDAIAKVASSACGDEDRLNEYIGTIREKFNATNTDSVGV